MFHVFAMNQEVISRDVSQGISKIVNFAWSTKHVWFSTMILLSKYTGVEVDKRFSVRVQSGHDSQWAIGHTIIHCHIYTADWSISLAV